MLRVNGFYGHVQHNNLRSLMMFAGFAVAFQLVGAVALTVPLFVFDFRHAPIFDPHGYLFRYGPILFLASAALFLVRFLAHVATMQAATNFSLVGRHRDPRLANIVEELALAAGVPYPAVGLIESPARNAFACGLSTDDAVVVVTRGLLKTLDDDELAAVVAHEIAHIRNGDIRLMAAANVLMEILQWLQRINVLRISSIKRAILAVLFLPYLMLALFGGILTTVGVTLARVSRLLISSSREFIADAEAVRLTHNPAALISALRRIEGNSTVEGLDLQADAMMIDGAVEGAFASHPTIAERIEVLSRLAGPMAVATRPRIDMRPLTRTMEHRATFGLRTTAPAATATVPAPSRLLARRVNADSNVDLFGMTPAVRRVLIIGSIAFAASQIWPMRTMAPLPEKISHELPAKQPVATVPPRSSQAWR